MIIVREWLSEVLRPMWDVISSWASSLNKIDGQLQIVAFDGTLIDDPECFSSYLHPEVCNIYAYEMVCECLYNGRIVVTQERKANDDDNVDGD